MTKTKIMPGELFIVEYVNGGFVNKWAINASKDYITIEKGRKAAAGFTDVLVEDKESEFGIIDNRFHITGNVEAIKFVADVAFGEQNFAAIPLKVLKVTKETDIYDRTGAPIGTIPAGSLIGTENGVAGNSMRHLMLANAFNDGTGWKFVNQAQYNYGFVNVQKGFGLNQFDPTKTLETAISGTVAEVDWALIDQVVETDAPEQFLRGDLTLATKEDVVQNVNDHFASKDLAVADSMDPVAFFANVKNRAFVERELNKVDPQKAANFAAQAAAF